MMALKTFWKNDKEKEYDYKNKNAGDTVAITGLLWLWAIHLVLEGRQSRGDTRPGNSVSRHAEIARLGDGHDIRVWPQNT